jgi:hypothetical protein
MDTPPQLAWHTDGEINDKAPKHSSRGLSALTAICNIQIVLSSFTYTAISTSEIA